MQNDWISVEERPPEVEQTVLVYFGSWMGDLMWVRTYKGNGKWEDEYGYLQTDEPITHWRELPKPPKQECVLDLQEKIDCIWKGEETCMDKWLMEQKLLQEWWE